MRSHFLNFLKLFSVITATAFLFSAAYFSLQSKSDMRPKTGDNAATNRIQIAKMENNVVSYRMGPSAQSSFKSAHVVGKNSNAGTAARSFSSNAVTESFATSSGQKNDASKSEHFSSEEASLSEVYIKNPGSELTPPLLGGGVWPKDAFENPNRSQPGNPTEIEIAVPVGERLPAAYYDEMATTPQQKNALNRLLIEFEKNISEGLEQGMDEIEVWRAAREIADKRYLTLFGFAAYNSYHIKAAKEALQEKRKIADESANEMR